jgi:hypothetical protein
MRRIRTFVQLPSAQRYFIGKSVLLVGGIRIGLWLLPFRTLRHLVVRVAPESPERQEVDQAFLDRVVWAVTVASRCVPKATCLARALAAQVLLARRGHLVHLRIGVARSETCEFEAHAWVECQGRVVIGGTEAPWRFTPLPPLEGKRL